MSQKFDFSFQDTLKIETWRYIMSTIGYVRVSTDEQTTENQQRQTVERYQIDKWFNDEVTSGTTKAIGLDG